MVERAPSKRREHDGDRAQAAFPDAPGADLPGHTWPRCGEIDRREGAVKRIHGVQVGDRQLVARPPDEAAAQDPFEVADREKVKVVQRVHPRGRVQEPLARRAAALVLVGEGEINAEECIDRVRLRQIIPEHNLVRSMRA